MIKNNLICHPGATCTAVGNLLAGLKLLPEGGLLLSYELTGDLAQICIPAPQSPAEVDGLWEHTCFEAFIAVADEAGYREFNFSPSGQWAAYAFSGYRVRGAWTASQTPIISFARSHGHLRLETVIAAADLPQNIAGKPLQLGLTAVVEANDGSRTYWALQHPEAHPDFHHRAGFVLPFNET